MSLENFCHFMQAVLSDQSVLDQVQSLEKNDIHGLLACAKTLGFEFSAEDMVTIVKQTEPKFSPAEISDSHLDDLTGGYGWLWDHDTDWHLNWNAVIKTALKQESSTTVN